MEQQKAEIFFILFSHPLEDEEDEQEEDEEEFCIKVFKQLIG